MGDVKESIELRERCARALAACFVVLAASQSLHAQAALPVLASSSRSIDIQDGDRLLKGAWSIDPSLALDVYDARRSDKPKLVRFISDVDALTLEVEPGHTYDFEILLEGTQRCATRLSTLRQAYGRETPARDGAPDQIPFTRRAGRIHVQASVNGSPALDLMFDTGADIVALRPSALERGAELSVSGTSLNRGFGGTTLRQLSRDNRVTLAGLIFEHEPILYFGEQGGDESDGVLGYCVFDGKVLEIDYDKSVLIVHDAVPASATGFATFPMRFEGALPTIETTLGTASGSTRGWFVIDTGATAALQLRQDFVRAHALYDTLPVIGSSTSRGVGSGAVRNQVVLLPSLAFGELVLRDVPTHLEERSEHASVSSGCLLGMDVLQRFHTLLDYSKNEVHLKPNGLVRVPFQTSFSGPPTIALLAFGALGACALVGVVAYRARRRKHARMSGQTSA
jgi:predicted aspartyl protease